MKYKIKRVYYNDGTKSPWWTIVIYKNGRSFDESKTQYSSFLTIFKIWLKAILFY
jgi:hypothetical protein